MDHYIAAQHAALLVGIGVYVRGFLGLSNEDEPEVAFLRVTCTHQSSGLAVVEWELVNREGIAIGGGAT